MDKLIGSTTSPFVRKLRMIIIKHNFPIELEAINYLEAKDSEYLKSVNPINKIPILITQENGKDIAIYDSRVIYNYLAKKYQLKPLSIQDENIYSAIDGLIETSVNLFSLRRGGLQLNNENSYIVRQMDRIPSILLYLLPWVNSLDKNNPEHWNILSMNMYSYLYWANFREILDLSPYPAFQKFLADFSNHPGVKETSPDKN